MLPAAGLAAQQRAQAGAPAAFAGGERARRAGIIVPAAALLLLLAALCAGCGQKGDLYLPDEAPAARAGR